MSHWNYRVFREAPTDDLRLVEAYYDDNSKVWGYVECDESWLTFEDMDSAYHFADQFTQALARPVLYPSDVVGQSPGMETVEPW